MGLNFFDKIKIGLTTIKNIVTAPATATKKVSDIVYHSRINTCQDCKNFEAGKCLVCGCNVFDKAQYVNNFTQNDLPPMSCPVGKWEN